MANVNCYGRTIEPQCAGTILTNRRTDGIAPAPTVVTIVVEEGIAIETRTPAAVVTIGVVVDVSATTVHYCATNLGARSSSGGTACRRCSVPSAIVASVVGTYVAAVAIAANAGTNTASIITALGANSAGACIHSGVDAAACRAIAGVALTNGCATVSSVAMSYSCRVAATCAASDCANVCAATAVA